MSDFLFILKKFFLYLLYPSSLIFIFLLLVSLYVILEKRRGRRRLLLFLAIFLYYASCTPFLPYFMLKHLENKYIIPDKKQIQKAEYIVVLTGRIYENPGLSLEERFSRETIIRFLKALELKKKYPNKKIIILGGAFRHKQKKGASFLKDFAKKLGVKVIAVDTPLDTLNSARVLKKYVNLNENFLLLTSAYHLPRAVYLFKKEGFKNLIPYPTNYNYKLCKPSFSIWNFFPDDLYLELTNMAVHEYLGLIFYKLKYTILKIGAEK
ncbi:MAG: hypothetical protein DRP29_02060 [Thermodesulfobacteriota bacterium]|nr:MAG: hypothetical protein DRP29_02060 [Thermodesulfobacteriota bacterium]